MTLTGWIFMTLSLGFVLALAGYCYARVLSGRPPRDPDDPDGGP